MTVASVVPRPRSRYLVTSSLARRYLEVDRRERTVGHRLEEACLGIWSAVAGEHVSDLGGDGAGDEDLAAREVERCQQVHALAVTSVVGDGCGHEWPGVADDHRLAAETFGQDLVYAHGCV